MTFSTVSTLAPSDSISVRGSGPRRYSGSSRRFNSSSSPAKSSRGQQKSRESPRFRATTHSRSEQRPPSWREGSSLRRAEDTRPPPYKDIRMESRDITEPKRSGSPRELAPLSAGRSSATTTKHRSRYDERGTLDVSREDLDVTLSESHSRNGKELILRTSRDPQSPRLGSLSTVHEEQLTKSIPSASTREGAISSRSTKRGTQLRPLTSLTQDSSRRTARDHEFASANARRSWLPEISGRQSDRDSEPAYAVEYVYSRPADVKRDIIVTWG